MPLTITEDTSKVSKFGKLLVIPLVPTGLGIIFCEFGSVAFIIWMVLGGLLFISVARTAFCHRLSVTFEQQQVTVRPSATKEVSARSEDLGEIQVGPAGLTAKVSGRNGPDIIVSRAGFSDKSWEEIVEAFYSVKDGVDPKDGTDSNSGLDTNA